MLSKASREASLRLAFVAEAVVFSPWGSSSLVHFLANVSDSQILVVHQQKRAKHFWRP